MTRDASARSTCSDMGGLLEDLQEAGVGGLVGRGLVDDRLGVADVVERADLAGGAQLDEDVAQRRRLDRAGENLTSGDVGGQPAQLGHPRAPADDAEAAQLPSGYALEALEDEAVLAGQGDEDAANGLGAVARRGLTAAFTRCG